MRVFRRSKTTGIDPAMVHAASRAQVTEANVQSREGTGPVLVAVNGNPNDWDALEWAAAEASVRQCALRIVHSIRWTPTSSCFAVPCSSEWGEGIGEAGRVLDEAVRRAQIIDPNLGITTHMHQGALSSAVLTEGAQDALIVLGRGRKAKRSPSVVRSVINKSARHVGCPVAIVTLFGEAITRHSSGRVVVGVDRNGDPDAAFDFAFRAAQRRGVGLTALRMRTRGTDPLNAKIDEALWRHLNAFPDIEVRQSFVRGTVGQSLVVESAGASLIVLGTGNRRRLRRTTSSARTVARSGRRPVVIVGILPAKRRMTVHGDGVR